MTIILLIGIWISLTKKPMKPIIAKPYHLNGNRKWSIKQMLLDWSFDDSWSLILMYNDFMISHLIKIELTIAVAIAIFWNSFLSGFVHLLTKRIESFVNFLIGSVNNKTCSIFLKMTLRFDDLFQIWLILLKSAF